MDKIWITSHQYIFLLHVWAGLNYSCCQISHDISVVNIAQGVAIYRCVVREFLYF